MSPPLRDVNLSDTRVLPVEASDSRVCFELDAALNPGHPLFNSPPKPGELHAYERVVLCIEGQVGWNEGPDLTRPAIDATGETDYGRIDAWLRADDSELLEGAWGCVVIRGAIHTVTYPNIPARD